jgi:hypothetical protein
MKKAFLAEAITLLLATGAAHAEAHSAKAELPNHMIGTRAPMVAAPPPMDAQVIAGTILGVASMFARGRY